MSGSILLLVVHRDVQTRRCAQPCSSSEISAQNRPSRLSSRSSNKFNLCHSSIRSWWRYYSTVRLTETRVPTVQVDPLTKKQPTLNMIELFANDSGKFIKGYCDRMVTKAELASETAISLRDLRSITESSHRRRRIATLISRPHAMIFHMDPIQAVIQFDKVRLFNLRNEDTYQAQVKDRLVTRIRKSSASYFELRALEALLIATIEHLEADFDRLQPEISDLLERLVYDQSAYHLLLLKDLSDKLESFEADVATVHSALSDLLNNDEDMAQMYLTNAHNGQKQAVSDHTDVETLLESFVQQSTELDNRVQQLKGRIRNIEEYIRIHFDSQRNKLMRMNLLTSIATLSFSVGATGASLFGMNLLNGFESTPGVFYIVTGALASASGLMFLGLYRVYTKTKERIPRPFSRGPLGYIPFARDGRTESRKTFASDADD